MILTAMKLYIGYVIAKVLLIIGFFVIWALLMLIAWKYQEWDKKRRKK